MSAFWGGIGVVVGAAITAAVTWLSSRRSDLFAAYGLEERRKLRDLMGKYTGPLLEAAIDWDRRMMQLYDNVEKPKPKKENAEGKHDEEFYWHLMSPRKRARRGCSPVHRRSRGDWRDPEEYFYLSVVFRFLALLAIARRFEAEAFYINANFKDREKALIFLRYAKSFIWAMTYSELSPDDGFPGRDHFRSDELRPMLDLCFQQSGAAEGEPDPSDSKASKPELADSKAPKGQPIFDWSRFLSMLKLKSEYAGGKFNPEIEQVLGYFNELWPVEYYSKGHVHGKKRRRWERLICLHLLTLNFIATFGYTWQQDIGEHRARAISFLRLDPAVADAFLSGSEEWLGLDKQNQMKCLKEQLGKALKEWRDAKDDDFLNQAVDRLKELGATMSKDLRQGPPQWHMRDKAGNAFSIGQEWLRFIGKRQAFVAAIVVHDGRVLLVRPCTIEPGPKWRFPKVKLKPGETAENAKNAAVRETLKETGLTVIARLVLSKPTDADTAPMTYVACDVVFGTAQAAAPEVAEVTWCGSSGLRKRLPHGMLQPVQDYLDPMLSP